MSSSPDPAASGDPAAPALDILRGQPNPFDNLVRPQRRDGRFTDLHEPALLHEPRELLFRIVDVYRLTEYRSMLDLPETRVVTVLGARGAGKTHMLQALADRGGQILVQPTYFEVKLPFEEYLLSQLAAALLSEERPFTAIAAHVTRRLLLQTLRALGPTDRLFASVPQRRWRLLWGGGEAVVTSFTSLARELVEQPGIDLLTLAERQQLSPRLLLQLVAAHLDRHETGEDVLSAVRRQLYGAMARAALLGEGDALSQFLDAEYTPAGTRPFYRADVVRRLLCALVEVCALVRRPVVVAFDNLEGLLAPADRFDPPTARAFLDGLAQAVDSLRGLLFVLFAESELFRQILKNTNQFALDRLRQGVPLHARGPVYVIDLNPPSLEELQPLIAARVGRLLARTPSGIQAPALDVLPPGFPFRAEFLQELAQKRDMGLRNKLVALRDEYSRVVYGRDERPRTETRAPARSEPDWQFHLGRVWSERLTEAGRQLQGGLAGHRPAFHAGLGKLLLHAGTITVGDWRLGTIESVVTLGDSPSYGMVTRIRWQRSGESAGQNGGPDSKIVGVGFLLAAGRWMPADLKTKFELFKDKSTPADFLVVLWPRELDTDDAVSALPAATHNVWKAARWRQQAELRVVEPAVLRSLLALPAWLDAIQSICEQPPPPAEIEAFLQKHGQSMFQLLSPDRARQHIPSPLAGEGRGGG